MNQSVGFIIITKGGLENQESLSNKTRNFEYNLINVIYQLFFTHNQKGYCFENNEFDFFFF